MIIINIINIVNNIINNNNISNINIKVFTYICIREGS